MAQRRQGMLHPGCRLGQSEALTVCLPLLLLAKKIQALLSNQLGATFIK